MECKPADRAAFQSHLFPPLSSDLLPLLGLGRRCIARARVYERVRQSEAHRLQENRRATRHARIPADVDMRLYRVKPPVR